MIVSITKTLPDIEVISEFDRFCSMEKTWNDLVSRTEKEQIFFTHEWFKCWWEAYGSGRQMFVVTVKMNGEVIGIAPLMICRTKMRGLPVTRLQFMSNNDSPWCDFIISSDHELVCNEIIDTVLYYGIEWDVLLLENVPKDSISIKFTEEILRRKGIKFCTDSKLEIPWISLAGGWDPFFRKLSRKARKTINNVNNRAGRLGHVEIRELNETGSLEDMVEISRKAWKYKEGKSYLNRDDRRRFFGLLSGVARSRGWLSLWFLLIDSKPVAYEYHLRYGSKDVALLAEFDQDYYRYSPGAVLDFQIIKRLFDKEGLNEYEIGGAYDEYKRKWNPDLKITNDYYIFNSLFYAQFLYYFDTCVVKTMKNFKKICMKD